VSSCPRCGGAVAVGQEYCLECGLTLPGSGRMGPTPVDPRKLAVPLLLAGLVAAAGATAAIALTRESTAATEIVTATGGSKVVSPPTAANGNRLVTWPLDKSGWTNILVSVPTVSGRDAALARAAQARRRGVRDVGVLDSSRFPSLHSGYWVVFAGIYTSEPEAASRLREAKAAQPGARSARISR